MTLTTAGQWTHSNWEGMLQQSTSFDLNGTGTAVIDWGDGTPNDTITFTESEYGTWCGHTYNDSVDYNIIIIAHYQLWM